MAVLSSAYDGSRRKWNSTFERNKLRETRIYMGLAERRGEIAPVWGTSLIIFQGAMQCDRNEGNRLIEVNMIARTQALQMYWG